MRTLTRTKKTITISLENWKRLRYLATDRNTTLDEAISYLFQNYEEHHNGGRGRKAKARPKREPINTEQEA